MGRGDLSIRKAAAGGGIPGGGTVTSVALSAPAEFNVSGSPIVGSGTLALTKANQAANLVYAGPESGGDAAPSFRALVADDLPTAISGQSVVSVGEPVTAGAVLYLDCTNARGSGKTKWWKQDVSASPIFTGPALGVALTDGNPAGFGSWNQLGADRAWNAVAMSSNGQYVTATAEGDHVYTSSDGGDTWTQRSPVVAQYAGLAMSASGQYQYFSRQRYVYWSDDFGATWTATEPAAGLLQHYVAVACSESGERVVVISPDGSTYDIFTSDDYGQTWTGSYYTGRYLSAVAMSASGDAILAVATQVAFGPYSQIYRTTNFGTSWTLHGPSDVSWVGVCMSTDGLTSTAIGLQDGDSSPSVFVSEDGGLSWEDLGEGLVGIQFGAMLETKRLACSSDGQTQAYLTAVSSGVIYLSQNAGRDWELSSAPTLGWMGIAIAADATKFIAAARDNAGISDFLYRMDSSEAVDVLCQISDADVSGFSGLTPGAKQFSSQSTPGGLTETEPAPDEVRKYLGFAKTETTLAFRPDGLEVQQNGAPSASRVLNELGHMAESGSAGLEYWEEAQETIDSVPTSVWIPKDLGSYEVNNPWVPVPNVTPSVSTQDVTSFGTFPPGLYRVNYVEGSVRFQGASGLHWVNAAAIYSFRVVYSGGNAEIIGPGNTYDGFNTQAECEAANAGAYVEFYHGGGTIGMRLNDTPLTDNVADSPSPTYELIGYPTTVEAAQNAVLRARGSSSVILTDGISAIPTPSSSGQLYCQFGGGYRFIGGNAEFDGRVSGLPPVGTNDFVTMGWLGSRFFEAVGQWNQGRVLNGSIEGIYWTPNSIFGSRSDAIIAPRLSGAFLTSIPDGTYIGGNNRGASAVDLQTYGNRGANTHVASGTQSVLTGGYHNTASGDRSVCAGGTNNTASGFESVVPGGNNNIASGTGAIAAGLAAQATHYGSMVISSYGASGATSSANDECTLKFPGGYRLLGGHLAVEGDMEAAAYSGGSATLSGSLSAGAGILDSLSLNVTPLGVLSGGTGADNAGDARTNLGLEIGVNVQAYSSELDTFASNGSAYYLNRANHTGTQDVDTLTGILPSANGGTGNGFAKLSGPSGSEKTFTLPDASATILTDNDTVTVEQGGTGRAAANAYAVVCGGTTDTGAHQSVASLGTAGQVLTSNGAGALPTWQDNIAIPFTLFNTTTDATPTELFINGTSSRLGLVDTSVLGFTVRLVGRRTDATGGIADYKFEGTIYRDSGAGSTSIAGTVIKTVVSETNAAWDADVDADATNGSLRIMVTGEAAKTIKWKARVDFVEVIN